MTPKREIRASYTSNTIRVYQAYNHAIADSALQHNRFVSPPFKRERMTWIKPSFLWMMYRAGWGLKDAGQSRILAVDISHDGFLWALQNSVLSHHHSRYTKDEWDTIKHNTPVRIQWDPERDIHFTPLEHRSIQIGLSGEAVERYIDEWIVNIEDVTELSHRVKHAVDKGNVDLIKALLPEEKPFNIQPDVAEHIEIIIQ